LVAWLCCASTPALEAQISPATLPNLALSGGGWVGAIAVQDDGKVIIGGTGVSFTAINGQPRLGLARLNQNGTVDATWNPGPWSALWAVAIYGEHLYVASGGLIARVSLATGQQDPTWYYSITAATGPYYASVLLVSGSNLYVGGRFDTLGGQPRTNLARIALG